MFNPSPRDKTHNLRYNLEKSLVRSFKFYSISSVLPAVPPWLFSSSNIILSLTKFPKRSTPLFVYRSHFQEIINSYTNPTICYTDGSKTKDRAGFAFSINNYTQAHPPSSQHRLLVHNGVNRLFSAFSNTCSHSHFHPLLHPS